MNYVYKRVRRYSIMSIPLLLAAYNGANLSRKQHTLCHHNNVCVFVNIDILSLQLHCCNSGRPNMMFSSCITTEKVCKESWFLSLWRVTTLMRPAFKPKLNRWRRTSTPALSIVVILQVESKS